MYGNKIRFFCQICEKDIQVGNFNFLAEINILPYISAIETQL